MTKPQQVEEYCRARAQASAEVIEGWMLGIGVPEDQPLVVLYLGTGWDVFGDFEGCRRIALKDIDPGFGCLKRVEGHPLELVYIPDFEKTGTGALVLRGRPHLYQKWLQVVNSVPIEVSAKYLVRLHTEMMLYLGLLRPGRVGPFIVTSATGKLDPKRAPVGSIVFPDGFDALNLHGLPLQHFGVARAALCHELRSLLLSARGKLGISTAIGGLWQVPGPPFEDPGYEQPHNNCLVAGMSGVTACHLIAAFNALMLAPPKKQVKGVTSDPDKVVRACLECLVTDDPYRPELCETNPFAPDSPWRKSAHEAVLDQAGEVAATTRQLLINQVRAVGEDPRF